MTAHVAVVGGGITALAAARTLALAGATVTVVEPDQVGGKLRASAFDGSRLDDAADAFLARVPEGVELCRSLGIDGDLVSPSARRAYVWSEGALRLLPEEQVLGVPTDLDALGESGILSADGLIAARRDLERPLVAPEGDVTIGSVMRDRLGDEVSERLVDPLVGGINAGDTDHLSLAATVPQLDAAVRSGAASLIAACRVQRAAVTDRSAPVFFAPRGGMIALVEALQADLSERGVTWRAAAAQQLERAGVGHEIPLDDGSALTADAVVLACPAPTAGDLLGSAAPEAAALLASIPYASVAMVSLAVRPDDIDRPLDASGYLVPRTEGRTLTACSWTSAKWAHLHGDDTVWLRASVGRDGAAAPVHLPDDELLAVVLADLRATMALRGTPVETRIRRWVDSFPQYRPGHLGRVAAIEADVAVHAPRVAVAGAALRGLGVPACIRQGQEAARHVLDALDAPS